MKREDVKNKIPGITEEQLNWLMQENGSDITREKFLSTLSLRRATALPETHASPSWISIHALLAESDGASQGADTGDKIFLSTLSLRRATVRDVEPGLVNRLFLSTLSLRRATPNKQPTKEVHTIFLSTLSLRRATRRHRGNDRRPIDFYPRSPCGERHIKETPVYFKCNFYPRSPCGERQ